MRKNVERGISAFFNLENFSEGSVSVKRNFLKVTIYSYQTPIAIFDNETKEVFLNDEKFSTTTSHLQNSIKNEISKYYPANLKLVSQEELNEIAERA